jgi:hypothetical protein
MVEDVVWLLKNWLNVALIMFDGLKQVAPEFNYCFFIIWNLILPFFFFNNFL